MKSSSTYTRKTVSIAHRYAASNARTPLTHTASNGASETMCQMITAYYGREKEHKPAPAKKPVTIRHFSWEV